MDPSYTSPLGGPMQPTKNSPQGDIILAPSQPKWDLRRILTLAGIAIAVVILCVIAVSVVIGNNRAASDAKAAARAEKDLAAFVAGHGGDGIVEKGTVAAVEVVDLFGSALE